MPQVDDQDNLPENNVIHGGEQTDIHELQPDFPPESFWLSRDAELDWMDQNAYFERKESTKGNMHNQQHAPGSNSTSQRFSLNLPSKSAIIGLPKTQKPSYTDSKRRNANKPGNVGLFMKKTGIVGKPAGSLTEPSSPKVSCMGRVRSKSRSVRASEPDKQKKTGCCSEFMKIFKGNGKSNKNPIHVKEKSTVEEVPRKSLSGSRRMREFSISTEPVNEPPGLGGMKRFASGRRSTDEFDGVVAGSFELDRRVGPIGSS